MEKDYVFVDTSVFCKAYYFVNKMEILGIYSNCMIREE